MTWTLVSDRTPEPGQTVLAWWPLGGDGGFYDVALLNRGIWRPDDEVDPYIQDPYAWMPLPPPPEMNI
jgi:hypothetical protein